MSSHSLHASRPSTFRAPGWGALASLSSCCRWRNATSQKLVPFSHRSASRIFIRQPDCIPSPVVTQDGDHQFDGGGEASRAAASAPLSASRIFIILAGAEAGLSRSSTSHAGSWVTLSFSIQGRGRSPAWRKEWTSITRGWSAAGVVSFSVLGSLAQLALAQLPVPPSTAVRGAAVAHRGTAQDVARC
jgi:hypothetical protein